MKNYGAVEMSIRKERKVKGTEMKEGDTMEEKRKAYCTVYASLMTIVARNRS